MPSAQKEPEISPSHSQASIRGFLAMFLATLVIVVPVAFGFFFLIDRVGGNRQTGPTPDNLLWLVILGAIEIVSLAIMQKIRGMGATVLLRLTQNRQENMKQFRASVYKKAKRWMWFYLASLPLLILISLTEVAPFAVRLSLSSIGTVILALFFFTFVLMMFGYVVDVAIAYPQKELIVTNLGIGLGRHFVPWNLIKSVGVDEHCLVIERHSPSVQRRFISSLSALSPQLEKFQYALASTQDAQRAYEIMERFRPQWYTSSQSLYVSRWSVHQLAWAITIMVAIFVGCIGVMVVARILLWPALTLEGCAKKDSIFRDSCYVEYARINYKPSACQHLSNVQWKQQCEALAQRSFWEF